MATLAITIGSYNIAKLRNAEDTTPVKSVICNIMLNGQ